MQKLILSSTSLFPTLSLLLRSHSPSLSTLSFVMAVSFSLSRAAFLASAVNLSILSITTIGLQSLTLASISNPIADGSSLINFVLQTFPELAVLPQNLNDANLKFVLASSVLSLIVSLLCITFTVWAFPNGKRVSQPKNYNFCLKLPQISYPSFLTLPFLLSSRNSCSV